MKARLPILLITIIATTMQATLAQDGSMTLPKTVEAGEAFSIQSAGSGNATLYIIGLGQVIKRDVVLGEATYFPAGSVYNAGHYLAVVAAASHTESSSFDVEPAAKPAQLSFIAKPSRLPVDVHDGISGAVYVFDAYHNLITAPAQVLFELSSQSGAVQQRTVVTHDGSAWVAMDSTVQQGTDRFVARIGDTTSVRVVSQVPGDPCGLKMSALQSGHGLRLATEPVRDCNGNAVPDGTIVTFTESYGNAQSTVDVPLKRGIAEVTMVGHEGATFSVASGVVLGNQIRWAK